MQVFDGVRDFDGLLADLVGGTDAMPRFHAAAGHPDGHSFGVVVAADRLRAAADTVVGRAAELAGPDDQRFVEQSALPQVGDQSAAIGLSTARIRARVTLGQVVV